MLNEVIGNLYRIVEKIGEGGMGEVFRGVDINLDRDVAIKVMRPELARRPEILQRFRKEAVVLAKLNHSNIATLYNFVHDGTNYYMVMEFAPGRTLHWIIADDAGGLPWRYSLELFMDALQAIDHAHKQGIIHRDIKPANMMVSERDTLKVLDFGIARVLGESGFTKAGLVVGTTRYMSPEQILGRSIDTRSDIYALGIVLYEMLTGHVPFEGLGEFELMKAQVEERAVPVREIIPDLPEAVDEAIMRSLEKAPEDRFQRASECHCRIGADFARRCGQLGVAPQELARREFGLARASAAGRAETPGGRDTHCKQPQRAHRGGAHAGAGERVPGTDAAFGHAGRSGRSHHRCDHVSR